MLSYTSHGRHGLSRPSLLRKRRRSHAFGTATMAATTAHDWYDLWYRSGGHGSTTADHGYCTQLDGSWSIWSLEIKHHLDAWGIAPYFRPHQQKFYMEASKVIPLYHWSSHHSDQKGCPIQKFTIVIHFNLIIQTC